MIYIIKDEANIALTSNNYKIMHHAALKVSSHVTVIEDMKYFKKARSTDLFIVGTVINAIKLYFKGYKNIIVWFQGIVPEESYTRNHNILMKKILEFIERYVIKKSLLLILVSNAMKDHYKKKYKTDIDYKSMIMPCFNTEIHKESFFTGQKYEKNIFTYAGGLSIWQKFDEILKIYGKIEKLGLPETKLLVFTKEKEKAELLIKEQGIKSFEIKYVKPELLPEELSIAKYGFIVRDDVLLNNVSTPTKISTYVSNGIIPIYSSSICDFHNIIKNKKYKLTYDSEFYSNLTKLSEDAINPEEVYNEYNSIFMDYYNNEKYENLLYERILHLTAKHSRITIK